MEDDPKLHKLIESFYRAAVEHNMWDHCLEQVTSAFNSNHTILFGRSTTSEFNFGTSYGISQTDQARHFEVRGMQLWLPLDAQVKTGRAVLQSEIVADSEFENSDFYNELIRPTHTFYGLTAKQTVVDSPFQFTICRERKSGEYTETDRAKLDVLLPHLTAAFELHDRLKTHRQKQKGLQTLMHHLQEGAVVFNSQGRIILANAKAIDILSNSEDVQIEHDIVKIKNVNESRKLNELLKNASGPFGAAGRMAMTRGSGSASLLIRVLPIQESLADFTDAKNPAAIMFFKEPDTFTAHDRYVLSETFNLTEREAEISSLIAKGQTPEAISNALGIGVRTVRWNLSAIYAKTGVNTQTALAVLVHQLR